MTQVNPVPMSETTTALLSADQVTSFRAFGTEVTLTVGQNTVANRRKQDELHDLYESFLASRVLPRQGLCVDVGAAEGWFAVPFAQAFPNWQVLCFESDPTLARRLRSNVESAKLHNVIVIEAALHPDASPIGLPMRDKGTQTLTEATLEALAGATPAAFEAPLGLAPSVAAVAEGSVTRPAVPVEALTQIAPDFLKMDAPGCEAEIAAALKHTAVNHIVGPLWRYQPSNIFQPAPAAEPREFYLAHGQHALRRDYEDSFASRRPGLDIVVALYNGKDHIVECVDSLLADRNPDIRVLVVDDGSNDGSDELIRSRYANEPNVVLLHKANGGAASARNFGRQASDASHIAFVDADDRIDPGMFTALLEVARYTGAPVTEAEFSLLEVDENGEETLTPSYESAGYATPGTEGLGAYAYHKVAGHHIATGQPAIWRRVHRRDFLDRNNIWFPEHVRAFDDQIFQLLLTRYCGEVPHVTGYAYHYRQHAAQDIKQGDERHFYSFNMYRSLFLRALDENWADLGPIFQSLLNTLSWSYHGLQEALRPTYRKAAAEFLAIVQMTTGHEFGADDLAQLRIEGLDMLLATRLRDFAGAEPNYAYMRSENWMWQPEFIRMMGATSTT